MWYSCATVHFNSYFCTVRVSPEYVLVLVKYVSSWTLAGDVGVEFWTRQQMLYDESVASATGIGHFISPLKVPWLSAGNSGSGSGSGSGGSAGSSGNAGSWTALAQPPGTSVGLWKAFLTGTHEGVALLEEILIRRVFRLPFSAVSVMSLTLEIAAHWLLFEVRY